MDEQFAFTPSAKESSDALRVVQRSIAGQAFNPVRRFLICAAIYSLPLIVAYAFFKSSFEEIYFTLFLFVVGSFVIPRLFGGTPTAIMSRYSVPTEVNFNADVIRQTTPITRMAWPWASLNRLHVLDQLIVFEFRDCAYVTLPNHLWRDEAERDSFLSRVRERTPEQLPSGISDVPTPFTLINVGAGLGAADVFFLLLFVLVRVADFECGCRGSWQIGGYHLSFGVAYAAVIATSFGAFFPIRFALRALQKKQRSAAAIIAHLLIWPLPVALIIFKIVH